MFAKILSQNLFLLVPLCITVKTDTIIQDNRVIETLVYNGIVYFIVLKEIIYLPVGGVSYVIIADLLKQESYLRKHWHIMLLRECVPEYIADELF